MKTIAIALCAAVLAGAGGLAIAKAGDSKVASPSTTQQSFPGGGPGGGGPGQDLSALAEDLGVSESKLQSAMQAARPSTGGFDPSEMAANLAKSLGLSTAAVQKAMEANRPDGGMGPGGAPPSGTVPRSGDSSTVAPPSSSQS